MNPAAIEEHLKSVLVEWMIIIAAAWAFGMLARRLGQPRVVGEILAGILLGPSALGMVWPANWPPVFPHETQQSLQLLGKLGVIFLLFQVGMEFDYSHLRTRSKTVTMVSLLGIVAPFACGLVIAPWLHRTFAPDTPQLGFQLLLCIALSISALPVMGRILLELKLERTVIGTVGISAAAVDDVVGWILLGTATALVTARFNGFFLVAQLAGVAVFFFLSQNFIGPWLRRLWRRGVANNNGEGLPVPVLTVVLLGLFASCLITHELGVFVLFGAFLFGVSLHQEAGLVRAWREKFADVVFVAFVPIFFTNTGLNTNIGSLHSLAACLACGVVLVGAVAGKLGGCYFGARMTGQTRDQAACIAALMNTRGLMALIAINVGLDLKLFPPSIFTMLVIMTLVTTAMCGPLLRWWLPTEIMASTSR